MKIRDSYVARRRFLGCMAGGGIVALGSGFVAPMAGFVGNLRDEPPPLFLEIAKADWDLAPGKSKMLEYGQIPALLIRTPRGELKVFVAVCTHFTCTVGYEEDKNLIYCACHEGYYRVDGQVDSGPPPRPLTEFFWTHSGDKLVIALEKGNLEKPIQESQT